MLCAGGNTWSPGYAAWFKLFFVCGLNYLSPLTLAVWTSISIFTISTPFCYLYDFWMNVEDSFSWCLSLLPSVFTAVAKSVIHFWTMGFEQQEYDKGFTFHRVNRLTSQRYEQPHCCHGNFLCLGLRRLRQHRRTVRDVSFIKLTLWTTTSSLFIVSESWPSSLGNQYQNSVPPHFHGETHLTSKNSKCRSSHDSQWKRRTLLKKQRQL